MSAPTHDVRLDGGPDLRRGAVEASYYEVESQQSLLDQDSQHFELIVKLPEGVEIFGTHTGRIKVLRRSEFTTDEATSKMARCLRVILLLEGDEELDMP
ncbi:hypothetical protein RM704_20685 [Streptomyces sp. DSM 3412]|uniref:Uncharacterized protein n=1 Tax=Streptomyces gottesmaniae TaxID=3075518 RepID=A0ABU2Z0Y2_9ACTN|nr:hypothetical protein [Streptomyces sp. DSM 3412]MDT0569856.1 hypothetical protein [Streptomyces sp. DSM 3412]